MQRGMTQAETYIGRCRFLISKLPFGIWGTKLQL